MNFNDIKTISETSTENNDANTLLILLKNHKSTQNINFKTIWYIY